MLDCQKQNKVCVLDIDMQVDLKFSNIFGQSKLLVSGCEEY